MRGFDCGLKKANMPAMFDQFGTCMDGDVFVGTYPVYQVSQQPLGIITFSHVIQIVEIPAQHFFTLYQMDLSAAVRKC